MNERENNFDIWQNPIIVNPSGENINEGGLANDIEVIHPQSSLTDFENDQVRGSSTNFSEIEGNNGNSQQHNSLANQQMEQETPEPNINESIQNNIPNITNSEIFNCLLNENQKIENNLGNNEQNLQMSISDQNSNDINSFNNNNLENNTINNLNENFDNTDAQLIEQNLLNQDIISNNQCNIQNSINLGGAKNNQGNLNVLIFEENLEEDEIGDNIIEFGNAEFINNFNNLIDENGDKVEKFIAPKSNKMHNRKKPQ